MAAQQGLSHINLLPKDSFEFSNLGKFLKWATTFGRIIVVLTELVVLLAFGSRFYFDRKINDLTETIDGKMATIVAYKEVEDDIRKTLAKQEVVKSYLGGTMVINDKFSAIGRVLPTGVVLNDLSLNGKETNFTGTSTSELAFSRMLYGLKKEPTVQRISLGETTYDQTSGSVKFGLRITYK